MASTFRAVNVAVLVLVEAIMVMGIIVASLAVVAGARMPNARVLVRTRA